LEAHLAFLDNAKAFDKVKREKLLEILQSKNIPNLLLKGIIEIYSGNKIKAKINNNTQKSRSQARLPLVTDILQHLRQ
jgi:hypothetical protein